MTVTLQVDGARWRARCADVVAAVRAALDAADDDSTLGDVVPVAKGNGYGLGNARLAREAARLGAGTLAVGTVVEAALVLEVFAGDVVVLEPFDPRDVGSAAAWAALVTGPHAGRVVRTLASPEAVAAVLAEPSPDGAPAPRVLLEGLTSMHRFGLTEPQVDAVLSDPEVARRLRLEGLTLHLPLVAPQDPRPPATAQYRDVATAPVERGSARAREVVAWGLLWTALLAEHLGEDAPPGAATVWASHLDDAELRDVRADLPEVPVRLRLGTRLWLGDRSLLAVTGTVLAVHETDTVAVGYTQRRARAVAVVSGGTAHGIAMAAPASMTGLRSRAVAAGTGVLESVGRARSPFTLAGRKAWFVEPPHMHVSLLRLDAGVRPAVGDEVPVEVRFTTLHADRVTGLD